ncbi:MAG TPA: hypothetical protein VLH19_05170 [Patescibacteria group bacterium]|nr:hypothetical protein [Patescibacteria group bacterium]
MANETPAKEDHIPSLKRAMLILLTVSTTAIGAVIELSKQQQSPAADQLAALEACAIESNVSQTLFCHLETQLRELLHLTSQEGTDIRGIAINIELWSASQHIFQANLMVTPGDNVQQATASIESLLAQLSDLRQWADVSSLRALISVSRQEHEDSFPRLGNVNVDATLTYVVESNPQLSLDREITYQQVAIFNSQYMYSPLVFHFQLLTSEDASTLRKQSGIMTFRDFPDYIGVDLTAYEKNILLELLRSGRYGFTAANEGIVQVIAQ